MRHQVVEQDKVLMDVYRSGGTPALDDAIADASEDPQAVVGMFDRHGATPAGNLVALPGARPSEGYHSGFVRLDGQPAPRRAAMIMHRLAGGRWLISGRLAGEGLAIRETLEGSLFIALALAVLPRLTAAEQGIYARKELGEGKGLNEIIVGAAFEPLDPVPYRCKGG